MLYFRATALLVHWPFADNFDGMFDIASVVYDAFA